MSHDAEQWLRGGRSLTVRRLVDERRTPYRKTGRLLRFDPDECGAWLEVCRVEAECSWVVEVAGVFRNR